MSFANPSIKVGCLIQGNIRVPLDPILRELERHFEIIVVSTWAEDSVNCPKGKYELILNDRPQNVGVTNRNLQRLTTARGLEKLREQGCTHVLKWRTDLLPTKLDMNKLLQLSQLGGGE